MEKRIGFFVCLLLLLSFVPLAAQESGQEKTQEESKMIERLGSISQITDDAQRLKAYDDLAAELGLGKKEKTEKGKWDVSVSLDPMDDSKKIILILSPTESAADFKKPVLVLRKTKSGLEIFFTWDTYLADNCKVTFRFDKEEAVSENWNLSSDNTATFCPKCEKFLLDLISHEKLAAQVTPYNKGPMTVVYDIRGLREILEEYEEFAGVLGK